MLAALVAAAAVVVMLTRPTPVTFLEKQMVQEPASAPGWKLLLESPVPMRTAAVLIHGEVMAERNNPGVRWEWVPEAGLAVGGTDVVVLASWEADGPHALRVRARDGVRVLADETFWAEGELAGTLFVPAAADRGVEP